MRFLAALVLATALTITPALTPGIRHFSDIWPEWRRSTNVDDCRKAVPEEQRVGPCEKITSRLCYMTPFGLVCVDVEEEDLPREEDN